MAKKAKNITIRFEGMKKLRANIERLKDAASGKEAEALFLAEAKNIAAAATRLAPSDTGRLKESIHSKQLKRLGGSPAPAIVAVDRKIAPHAHLVEFGTSHSAAQPFWRPAIKASKGIQDGIKKIIEKALK